MIILFRSNNNSTHIQSTPQEQQNIPQSIKHRRTSSTEKRESIRTSTATPSSDFGSDDGSLLQQQVTTGNSIHHHNHHHHHSNNSQHKKTRRVQFQDPIKGLFDVVTTQPEKLDRTKLLLHKNEIDRNGGNECGVPSLAIAKLKGVSSLRHKNELDDDDEADDDEDDNEEVDNPLETVLDCRIEEKIKIELKEQKEKLLQGTTDTFIKKIAVPIKILKQDDQVNTFMIN